MHSVRRAHRRLEPLELYALGLAVGSIGAVAGLIATGWTLGPLAVVLPLAAVAAISERASVTLSSTLDESISLVPTLLVAVLFGPLAAGIVAAVSMVPDLGASFERRYLRWGVYTSSRTAAAIATGLAASWTAALVVNPYAQVVVATAAGAVVALSLDVLFAVVTIRLRRTASPWELLGTLVPISIAAGLLYAPLVAILAIAYREVSPWTILLFFGPALAAHRLFALYQEQRRLAADLKVANLRLEKANLSFATALVTSLDARDRYTAGHSAAVAIYARDIAARMGFAEEQQRLAQLCGFVHDIGKIGLPPSLLEKPGALTLEERRQMERHSEIGERILSKVEDYAEIAAIVRHHHERVDGHGYPDGLSGDEIPILARIIAVADAYNAMTSDRPYRDAMPSRVARLRLAQAVESQFDTTVVAAFEAILAGASEAYKVGGGPAFQFKLREAEIVPSLALVSTATA